MKNFRDPLCTSIFAIFFLLLFFRGVVHAEPNELPIKLFAMEGHAWKILPGGLSELLASGAALDWGEGFRTDGDGQFRVEVASGFEIRVKENTIGWFMTPNNWRVDRGLFGVRSRTLSPHDIFVSSPHCEARFRDGIFVVKVVPLLTRIAVLKGNATVQKTGYEALDLASRQEVAAAFEQLSDFYQATDDLYFAWYWQEKKGR